MQGRQAMDRFWSLPRYPFLRAFVEQAPEQSGVYALFDAQGDAIYIGCALAREGGIRRALLGNLKARPRACAAVPANYTWEMAFTPGAREAQLISSFVGQHARMPQCQGDWGVA